MIAIAADRFRAVLFPLKPVLLSRNKCWLIIAATWIASVALQAHFLHLAEVVSLDSGVYCTFQSETMLQTDWVLTFSLTCVSAIVLTVLYSSIIISLHRQKKSLHLANEIIKKRESRYRKIAYMLVTIVIVFYVVWIPYHVNGYYVVSKPHIKLPCLLLWFALKIPLLYPVINPVVYYIFNEEYRQGFRELLCCPWPCVNKCNNCFRASVSPLAANNVHNAEQVNDAMEIVELRT